MNFIYSCTTRAALAQWFKVMGLYLLRAGLTKQGPPRHQELEKITVVIGIYDLCTVRNMVRYQLHISICLAFHTFWYLLF